MEEPLDLRPRKPEPAGTTFPFREVPGMGRLPFPNGKMILTGLEKKNLEALGWKEGDPIPTSLANEIAAVARETEAEIRTTTAVPADTPPLRVPPAVDITTLPPEKQQELRDFLKTFKAANPVVGMEVPRTQYHPSIAQTIEQISQAEVVDTRPKKTWPPVYSGEAPAVTTTTVPPPAPPAPVKAEEAKPAVPEPPTKPPLARADILAYAHAKLSGERFRKAYSFFGGKAQVVFRTLTIQDAERCSTQTALDRDRGQYKTRPELLWALLGYRLVVGLDKITLNGKTTTIADAVDRAIAETDPVSGTEVITELKVRLQEKTALSDESIWKMVQRFYQEFQALVEQLEVAAAKPDFSIAIEG